MVDVKIVTESKDSFYVHLLSNAQPELFKNKANHFKCRFQTALQFPTDENWEVGLKEYYYVNNIDTITKDVAIEVGRLAPRRENWQSLDHVRHDTDKVAYPFYFTECGMKLTVYKPFENILQSKEKQQSHMMLAFLNFLQQQRLLSVLRFVIRGKKSHWYQLKLRNTSSAVERLYFPCQYALCMSFPLALLLQASTQCIRNEKENLQIENGLWTQNDFTCLGKASVVDRFTLRCKSHPAQASGLVDILCKRLNISDPTKITNTYFKSKVIAVQAFLRESERARAEDYTFTFIPLHRNKKQVIQLKTAQLTYVELFRHLEELGYGVLHITPDQSSLDFTMHDLSESNLFAVELPSSLFTRYNSLARSFYPPQVRVDAWELQRKRFVRRYNMPLENAFSRIELSYADSSALRGITTMALEKELSKDLHNSQEVPDAQGWLDSVYREIETLKEKIHQAQVSFLHGRASYDSQLMTTNESFLLTSSMRITMTLDLKHRKTFTPKEMVQAEASQSIYTPYSFTLYDVKVPYSPESVSITSYTRSLDMGSYDIKTDDRVFRDVYTKYNTIQAPKGFYTPLSLIRHLQTEFDKYQHACTLSLVNKTGDDNGQGFLKIENNKETYLQFNQAAQELFRLPTAFLSPHSSFVTTKPFDLHPDSYTNIVYCDIVGGTVVGSTREKILCISPVRHSDYRYGQWVGTEFAAADYYPLAMKTVQQIEIQLRGDTGDFIPITQGRSYMKLHFRRKNTT